MDDGFLLTALAELLNCFGSTYSTARHFLLRVLCFFYWHFFLGGVFLVLSPCVMLYFCAFFLLFLVLVWYFLGGELLIW